MSSPAIQSWQSALDARNASEASRSAFAEFLSRGLPTQKLDAWKYTDLRRLALKQFQPATPSTIARNAIESQLLPGSDFHRLVFVDGALRSDLTLNAIPGVSVSPSVVTLPRSADDLATFELLNSALAADSIKIKIEMQNGLRVNRPIYIAWIWTEAARAVMTHPRIAIELGANANATLIEHHIGTPAGANFVNSVVEIGLAEHASLEHACVQEDGEANFSIGGVHADVAAGAQYRNYRFILGASLSRTDINVRLSGIEAATELHGLIFARNTQHLDVRTCIEHAAPNTRSREDYRGIADQRGRVVFNGKVIVAKDAQKTDAAQSSRNLLLGPLAEIDTRPELEIYANDVKCAHGATVGQLDAPSLFYLRSRGVSEADARGLLTQAFAAELIERVPFETLRTYLASRFMARMRADGVTP